MYDIFEDFLHAGPQFVFSLPLEKFQALLLRLPFNGPRLWKPFRGSRGKSLARGNDPTGVNPLCKKIAVSAAVDFEDATLSNEGIYQHLTEVIVSTIIFSATCSLVVLLRQAHRWPKNATQSATVYHTLGH